MSHVPFRPAGGELAMGDKHKSKKEKKSKKEHKEHKKHKRNDSDEGGSRRKRARLDSDDEDGDEKRGEKESRKRDRDDPVLAAMLHERKKLEKSIRHNEKTLAKMVRPHHAFNCILLVYFRFLAHLPAHTYLNTLHLLIPLTVGP
jgi:TATA-binding protein-associated factor Taf7